MLINLTSNRTVEQIWIVYKTFTEMEKVKKRFNKVRPSYQIGPRPSWSPYIYCPWEKSYTFFTKPFRNSKKDWLRLLILPVKSWLKYLESRQSSQRSQSWLDYWGKEATSEEATKVSNSLLERKWRSLVRRLPQLSPAAGSSLICSCTSHSLRPNSWNYEKNYF